MRTTALSGDESCNVLGRYLPEFGKVIGQMQHDLSIFIPSMHTL